MRWPWKSKSSATRFDLLKRQYEDMSGAIRFRVEIQQKNSQANILLVSAATGYLLTLVSQRGLQGFIESEMVVLLPAVSLISLIFLIRHIDHEVNITDYAHYVETYIRPRMTQEVGVDWMDFEDYLGARRERRYFGVDFLMILGNEAAIIGLPFLLYLGAAISVILNFRVYAGNIGSVYQSLTVVDIIGGVSVLVLAIRASLEYRKLVKVRAGG